ncbi:MAG: hypothetical protein ONB23_00660 [candidate division KSB1 bacterium]|nr:hypothetical protein [candidate division KSB1 bacterium]
MSIALYLPNAVSTASSALPVIAAAGVRRRLNLELRVIAGLLALYLCSDLAGMVMALQRIRNLWLANAVSWLDFPVLVWVFGRWERVESRRRALFYLIPAGLVLMAVTQGLVGSFQRYNFTGRSLQSVVVSGLAIYSLHQLAIYGEEELWRDPRFWVSLAVLVEFGGSVFAYSFGFLMETRHMLAIWPLHLLSNTLANFLFAGGFLCLRRPMVTGGSP